MKMNRRQQLFLERVMDRNEHVPQAAQGTTVQWAVVAHWPGEAPEIDKVFLLRRTAEEHVRKSVLAASVIGNTEVRFEIQPYGITEARP